MPRLFTAIELPEPVRDQLSDLESPLPGASWVHNDNLHLTLRFAGDVENLVAHEFAELLAGIEVSAFEMRLTGLGTFGGSEPHSIWVGVEAGFELDLLAKANERAARSAGLKPAARNFKPHVTIARLRHTRIDALARFLSHHGGFSSGWFSVERFVLYSSRPKVGGGPYVIEEAFPLTGAGWHELAGEADHA